MQYRVILDNLNQESAFLYDGMVKLKYMIQSNIIVLIQTAFTTVCDVYQGGSHRKYFKKSDMLDELHKYSLKNRDFVNTK